MSDGKKTKHPGSESSKPRDFGEYNFIKETIKEKPMNRKMIISKIAAITAGAILFGAVSAAVFAGVYPVISNMIEENKKPEKVDIDIEQPDVTEKPEETPVPSSETDTLRGITLEEYEKIYEEVHQIAKKPLTAMTMVTGVREEADLLDNSYVRYGQSSGVIIAKTGSELYVLTQKSVLGKSENQVQVTFCDGNIANGSLRKKDEGTGFAVVSVPLKNVEEETLSAISVASLGNSYSLMQGKPVIAIGSPTGYNETVAYGNIISVSNKISVVDAEYNLLVTDILGSKEGSGVLLDTSGSVIGIITQSFGDTADTMVKALSVAQLKRLLADLSNGNDICYAGIYGQDVTESIAAQTGIPIGIYVDSVATESPAMIAGIQSADVITELNGKEVTTMQKFSTELQKCKKDDKVSIRLMRKGNDGYEEMNFEIAISVK